MTSRECTCADPAPQMHVFDYTGPVPFDASRFVTYENEVDSAPTEAELVEELPERTGTDGFDPTAPPPEKPLRRGKGYLRAEAETAEVSDDEHEFGSGIEDAGTTVPGNAENQRSVRPTVIVTPQPAETDTAASPPDPAAVIATPVTGDLPTDTSPHGDSSRVPETDVPSQPSGTGPASDADQSERRRGRNSRRRRKRSPQDTQSPQLPGVADDNSATTAPADDHADSSGAGTPAADKGSAAKSQGRKRRRRRRGRGGPGGKPAGSSGDS